MGTAIAFARGRAMSRGILMVVEMETGPTTSGWRGTDCDTHHIQHFAELGAIEGLGRQEIWGRSGENITYFHIIWLDLKISTQKDGQT
jgi:hypothetical protein